MAPQDINGTPGDGAWPYTVRPLALLDTLKALDVEPSALSPLAHFVGSDSAREPVPALASEAHADERLRLALLTIADPRRLFSVTTVTAGQPYGAFFLIGDAAAIALQITDEAVSFSRAMSGIELAGFVARAIGAPQDDSRPAELIPANVLPTLAALCVRGLRDRQPVDIAEQDTLAAVRAGLGPDLDPELGLAALLKDGVIEAAGDDFRLTSAWLERFAYLVDEDRVELSSVELADVEAGYDTARRVSVLGASGRRRLALRSAPGSEATVALVPLTAALLTISALALVGPPRIRGIAPAEATGDDLAHWLDPSEGDGELADWRVSTADELAQGLAGGGDLAAAARAILGPAGELNITARQPRDAGPDRSVVGLTGEAAVQWTLDGSRVRWRALGDGGVVELLHGLLPDGSPATPDAAATHLSAAEFTNLAAGSLEGDSALRLPASLRGLDAVGAASWCSLQASRAAAPRHEALLRLAYGEDGALWRFDAGDDTVTATATTPDRVTGEIRAVFAG